MPEPEDKYSRFFREHNIDIEAIEEAALNGGGGGVTDHGALTGLNDDDHTQYHNNARGDARYYTKAQIDASLGSMYDKGDDTLGLYGYHSCTSEISSFRSEFAQNNEIWIHRVLVRAGRPINKIGTLIKTAGVLGAGGNNGFAITSDDGSTLLFSIDDDDIWTTNGEVSVSLGGSAIPAQTTDKFYRVQMSVHGYDTAPIVLLNQGDHAVLSDYQGRARFANASVGFQSGGGYNPLTFGTSTGGFYSLIMLG